MKKNVFSMLSARAALALAASLLIGLYSCKKEKSGSEPDPVGGGSVTMTTGKAVGEEINLWFAPDDAPAVEGAKETESKEEDWWLKKKYELTAQNLVIKGKVTKLGCISTSLTSLDVSNNTKLTELDCFNNQLTSLDVSKLPELTHLDCGYNSISSLDVSKNTELKYLYCSHGALSTLDVSKNTKLEYLSCDSNALTALDLRNNTKLKNLYCDRNKLNGRVSFLENVELEYLDCSKNSIQELHINSCTNLKELKCSENNLSYTSLILPQVSDGILLFRNDDKEENIDTQMLTQEEVSKIKLKGWTVKRFHSTDWKDFNGEHYMTLRTDKEVGENITFIYDKDDRPFVRGAKLVNSEYKTDWLFETYTLKSRFIIISGSVTHFTCSNEKLTNLDVSSNRPLERLDCARNNGIKYLYLNNNPHLKELICMMCDLYDLYVTENVHLTRLNCAGNRLTSLDVSKNKELARLDCTNNAIDELNVTQNTKLKILHCYKNKLEDLDASNCQELLEISCYNNNLKKGGLTLPDLNGKDPGHLEYCYLSENTVENNNTAADYLSSLKEKNWRVTYYEDGKWKEL